MGQQMKHRIYIIFICMTALYLMISETAKAEDELLVKSYYGEYDASQKKKGSPSAGLKGPVTETWKRALPKKPYHIGVLFPHLKDSYWITANYGYVYEDLFGKRDFSPVVHPFRY